jgi:hypothetical protein
MMWLAVAALVLLVILALFLATTAPAAPPAPPALKRIAAAPPPSAPPARFSTGFGQPLRPLDAAPEAARKWAPSMDAYFAPAGDCVPVDFPLQRVQDCPPEKPMSSALPIADVPMCALRA